MNFCIVVVLLGIVGQVLCADPVKVPLTEYVADGVKCLDGSVPAYYVRPGTGADTTKWIIHMEGGGWCSTLADCLWRAGSTLGSSVDWPTTLSYNNNMCCSYGGVLSDDPTQNPDFYSWNLAFIGYCDGTSFTSNLDKPIHYNNTDLWFRGWINLEATITDLLKNYLIKATDVIVSGCSAGGTSTYIHLDYFRSRIPSHITVKGFADAGYFMDYPTFGKQGDAVFTDLMKEGYELWNASIGINQNCRHAYPIADQWKCVMSPFVYPHVTTPMFILNSKYDSYSIQYILGLDCLPWDGSPVNCTADQKVAFLQYGDATLHNITKQFKAQDGLWLTDCVQHCQSVPNNGVLSWTHFTIDSVGPSKALKQWYHGKPTMLVDYCPYPCNKSCFI